MSKEAMNRPGFVWYLHNGVIMAEGAADARVPKKGEVVTVHLADGPQRYRVARVDSHVFGKQRDSREPLKDVGVSNMVYLRRLVKKKRAP